MTPLNRLYDADQRFPLEVGPGHIFAAASADRETLHRLIAVARAAHEIVRGLTGKPWAMVPGEADALAVALAELDSESHDE